MTPTPTPPPQQPRTQPGALVSLIGPLIGGFAGDNGSLRRFVLGAAGVAAMAGNHKLGLNLDTTELGMLAATIVSLVVGSNVKEVQKAKAESAAAAAEQLVPDLAAAVAELKKGPAPSVAVAVVQPTGEQP